MLCSLCVKQCDNADHTQTPLAYAESLPEGTQPAGGEKGKQNQVMRINACKHTRINTYTQTTSQGRLQEETRVHTHTLLNQGATVCNQITSL